jgi:medium-chain acyl-[acyl-carrier-protein] hydrolase
MGRADEPAFTDMEPFVTALADALTDLVDLPYCVFGYSLGGLVGFELCRELERRGMREPAVLIVAGCAAPHMVHHESHVAELDDRQLIELMNDRYAQIPAVLLEDPELRSQIVGAMRGDLTVFERYRYSQGARLNCQLTTLGGSSDPFCRTEQLAAWAELTSGPCLSRVFDGGHFFMHDHWSAVAELVAGELEQVARAG